MLKPRIKLLIFYLLSVLCMACQTAAIPIKLAPSSRHSGDRPLSPVHATSLEKRPMSPSSGNSLSTLIPIALQRNVATPLPETTLTATLLDYRYGRGRNEKGQDQLVAWASILFESVDGQCETVRWSFYETHSIFHYSLYLDGTRSTVLLYVLPPDLN